MAVELNYADEDTLAHELSECYSHCELVLASHQRHKWIAAWSALTTLSNGGSRWHDAPISSKAQFIEQYLNVLRPAQVHMPATRDAAFLLLYVSQGAFLNLV